MGESRLIVEELLALCLQRIRMEENTVNTEQGESGSHLRQDQFTVVSSCVV